MNQATFASRLRMPRLQVLMCYPYSYSVFPPQPLLLLNSRAHIDLRRHPPSSRPTPIPSSLYSPSLSSTLVPRLISGTLHPSSRLNVHSFALAAIHAYRPASLSQYPPRYSVPLSVTGLSLDNTRLLVGLWRPLAASP